MVSMCKIAYFLGFTPLIECEQLKLELEAKKVQISALQRDLNECKQANNKHLVYINFLESYIKGFVVTEEDM
jgi:hypothetical protein